MTTNRWRGSTIPSTPPHWLGEIERMREEAALDWEREAQRYEDDDYREPERGAA